RSLLYLSPFFSWSIPSLPFSPLSLHDALPISSHRGRERPHRFLRGRSHGASAHLPARRKGSRAATRPPRRGGAARRLGMCGARQDRKSTRLNSSHVKISYAVFCLKKKKEE